MSRAFLIMPFTFNIGVIIGPVLGGLLADPVGSYPSLFGPGSIFGGKDGVSWLKRWPYSPPNLLSAAYLFATAVMVFFFLEEVSTPRLVCNFQTLKTRKTHDALKDKPDVGLRMGRVVKRFALRMFGSKDHDYTSLPSADFDTPVHPPITPLDLEDPIELAPTTPLEPHAAYEPPYVLPLRKLFVPRVLVLLTSHFLMAMHIGTFNSLWFVFLSTPRFDPAHPIPATHTEQRLPFDFTGGLGLPPASVGAATAILGAIGVTLQLALYPPISSWLGTLRSYQFALCIFPLVYLLTPYLAVVPSSTSAPEPAAGLRVWLAITAVLSLQVTGRTFALPAQIILINNAAPHKSRLGTLHGVAQSVSSAARTLGPLVWAWVLGLGLSWGVVGLGYWGMAASATLGLAVAWCVQEGDTAEKTGESANEDTR
jgi:hypothetical protein